MYTGVNRGIQRFRSTEEYRGFQEYTGVYIGIKGFTGVYMGEKRNTGVYRSIHWCT